MALVGASQDSLSQVINVSGSTAALSAETGTLTAQLGTKVQTEIDQAADAFQKEFTGIGETMLAEINKSNQDVQGMEAMGVSPEQAKAAAADFATQLQTLQERSNTAIGEFRTSATNRAAAINDVIGPKLGAILTAFETDVTSFGTAVTGYSNGLADIDATSITYG